MRKYFVFLIVFIGTVVYGSPSDSLKIVFLQREVINLRTTVNRLQREDSRIKSLYQQQVKNLDSLRTKQQQQTENVKILADKIGADISDANQKIDSNVSTLSESIKNRTLLGALVIMIALGLLVYIYYILRRKISKEVTTIDKIRSAQEGLESAQKAMQEESIKLDSKLVELLDKKIEVTPVSSTSEQTDHTLALKVADEIVRIETNLSRMDESIKGHKQLKRAVERIRANFMANGYEIVDMLGKPYVEGMKATPNFIPDETLKKGEQIITGIIKPQINYKGIMIQSAQITVSQN